MSQSDYRKYWFMKLPKDFFKRHDVKILESEPNGTLYVLIYLKLLCESITHDGELRFNKELPYTESMLATICGYPLEIMQEAMKMLKALGLVEILDDGTILMTEAYKMIGVETGQTIRKREYRERKKCEESDGGGKMSHTCPTLVPHLSHDCPQEIEIEKEIELDKELFKRNIKEKNTKKTDDDNDHSWLDKLKSQFKNEFDNWDEEDEPDLQIEEEII